MYKSIARVGLFVCIMYVIDYQLYYRYCLKHHVQYNRNRCLNLKLHAPSNGR